MLESTVDDPLPPEPHGSRSQGISDRLASEITFTDPETQRAADMAEEIGRALRGTGYPALRAVEVQSCEGVVALWGCVPTYHQKQMAQAVAQRVAVGCRIENQIEVGAG
ncbi:MAG TPA: BON domain-containing protein [Planctomycetaceae bacterium]|jgi:osmotically-inducible protein OsmY|nr:BON domain-containing protein [Planctomycetaceae bacterium]